MSAFRSPTNTARVAGYGAFILALGYGLVSLYWAAGGRRGLGTLGEPLQQLAHSKDATAVIVISIVIVLKLMGASLALALVRPWGQRIPRRLLLIAGAVAAAVLILYGAVEMFGEALVETGAIRPSGHVDWRALRWHLGVWDLWFLAWGVALAVALRGMPVNAWPPIDASQLNSYRARFQVTTTDRHPNDGDVRPQNWRPAG